MGLFRKKAARVVRRSDAVEERTVRNVGNKAVTVRKFSTVPEQAEAPPKTQQTRKSKSGSSTFS